MAMRRLLRWPILVAGILFVFSLAQAQDVNIFVSENQRIISFVGPITFKASEKLIQVMDVYLPSALRITSVGGDIEAGMRIGAYIHEKRIDVVVSGACLSSCANYIFPAGRKRIIEEGGYVGWHGSATHLKYLYDNGLQKHTSAQMLLASRLAEKESVFFESLGVNGFICWFGRLAPFSSKNYFLLSKEAMEAFGITNVNLQSNYLDLNRREELASFTAIQNVSRGEMRQPR